MSYKKIVSLLAVSALALGACGAEEAEEEETDDTEEVEEVEVEDENEDEESSTQDLIEQAKGESGNAFPDYGLEVTGDWTVDGYAIDYVVGEAASVPVAILTDKEEYHVYFLEDGMISEIISNEEEIEFLVEDPSEEVEYHVGVSPDDLGEVGDEVSVDDFKRFEKIVFEEAEAEAEAEE